MISKFSLVVSMVLVLFFFSNGVFGFGQDMDPAGNQIHSGIYISGFIAVNFVLNDINANISLNVGGKEGRPFRGARIILNNVPIAEGVAGNYTGTARAVLGRSSAVMNSAGETYGGGGNIRLLIHLGGELPIEINVNMVERLSMSISPVQGRGVNLTGPVNISWSSSSSNNEKFNFAIINSRGEIVFEKINRTGRGMELRMPRRLVPPNGAYIFRISKFEKRIDGIQNASAGSYIDIYSDATATHNIFK